MQMLCSEYDIFLEMANIMKGLQLQILKGVLDNRCGELWAHFVIEVPKYALIALVKVVNVLFLSVK